MSAVPALEKSHFSKPSGPGLIRDVNSKALIEHHENGL